MKIFAVKDEKVGYISVVNEENVDVAKFNFGRGFYCEHPEFGRLEDYSLYKIGELDVAHGFVADMSPIFICNGLTAYNDFVSRLNSLTIERLKGVEEDADPDMAKESC